MHPKAKNNELTKNILYQILGHYILTYLKAYIFIQGWNGNLGTLFYTVQRCKKCYSIGPILVFNSDPTCSLLVHGWN